MRMVHQRKEIPKTVDRDRYKSKLEIVGIDCNDTPERWLAAVEEHRLPWINGLAIRKTFRQRKTSPSNMLSADTPPR